MILRRFAIRQARTFAQNSHQRPFQSRFLSNQVPTDTIPVAEAEASGSIQTKNVSPEVTVPPAMAQYRSGVVNKNKFNQLGSDIRNNYRPEDLISNPPRASDVTLELLLASQAHIGHSTSLWNPGNSGYIHGIREGVHIISLDVTAAHLRRAAKIVEEVARVGGLILFVGTRKGHKRAVVRAAELAQGCHVFDRWVPGSLTNALQLLNKCEVKLVDALDRTVDHPEFQGVDIERAPLKPDLVVCFNPLENKPLLQECATMNIPTIGVIDTDADPTRVTYPIPANDDSPRCISVIAGVLGRAGERGQQERLKQSAAGNLPYEPIHLKSESLETTEA
ncbi:40S ribosomal protein mrp4 [Nannizzia gypsea CBS 118893]|uniref:40S ribosomal protein mrp4 n=1 Tax=Arthroderma gypseum (strain ATCC MYA-4604 / CBS 118893) TaxID=535722 RepID=E5R102_ARTGP|nr:mitochondrial 37S ribosomal protein MRP4 [Nannizzia gypsea CBS 118893]EFQ97606.1 40S ribosomal protein mrp4 [Nannizzia gypsea CBS 118893]